MKVRTGLLGVAAAAVVGWSGTGYADDTFTKVPVQVNVLKGVTISDDDIAEIVKEANAILKQAKVALEFDKSKNITRDFNDQGNNDNKVDSGEDAKLDKFSVEELEKKFGKGKGYKVIFSDGIHGTATIGGLSPHDPDTPVTYINLKPTPEVKGNKAKGNDLAHEFAHVFTLGKNHKIDGTTNADDTWHHPTDKKNLMYPFNNGDTIIRGGELTPDQIKEIQEKAKKRGTTKAKTETSVVPRNTRHGSFTDDLNDTGTAHVDLFGGTFFIDHGSNTLDMTLGLNGVIPDGPFRTDYSVFFNTDDNPVTGVPFGVFEGVDKVVRLQTVRPTAGAEATVGAILIDPVVGSTQPIGGGFFERIDKINDVLDEGLDPFAITNRDKINQLIPINDFEITGDNILIGLDGIDFFTSQFDVKEYFEFETGGNGGPFLDIFPLVGKPGDRINVFGSGFVPNSVVDLFIDDKPLDASFLTDLFGDFSGDFLVPNEEEDFWFITARDAFSQPLPDVGPSPLALGAAEPGFGFDFSILTIVPEPGTGVVVLGLGLLGLMRRRGV